MGLWLSSRNLWFLAIGSPVILLGLLGGLTVRGMSVLSVEQAVLRERRLEEAVERRDLSLIHI